MLDRERAKYADKVDKLAERNRSLEEKVAQLTEQVQQLTEKLNAHTATTEKIRPNWATIAARAIPKFPPTYNTQSGNSPATLRITTALPSSQNTFSRYSTRTKVLARALPKR